jgi:hypothetical protein
VRDDLSLFGFGGQDACYRLFVGFFLWSLSEAAGEFVIADGLRGFEEGQKGLDLLHGRVSMIS